MTGHALSGSDLYDDPSFFAQYQRMRAASAGLNDELEQPALARMLPAMGGASVIELGCGDGSLARRLADAGARDVLAVDAARRMLALAARHPHPRVRYRHDDIETLRLPAASADCVVSSLALHYVRDYPGLIRRIAQWLRPGGQLVFSIEHPICTAQDPMTGWFAGCFAGCGLDLWPVDGYARETARTQQWFGVPVVKHHRRLTTLVTGLTTAGLILTAIDEPYPGDDVLARRPDLAQHARRPPLLLISARKPIQPS
jgi:ubiquinone/menaquinone biosynthesis C-methylase UbiE